MAHEILKPLSDEELKVRVGEFMNSFIALNKKNQASLDELKESYHDADLMLYHILRGSNGIVNSTRLLDILLTLVDYSDINSFMEFLKEFADKCHHGKEEGFLFPALEKTGVRNQGGPIGVMLSEHTMDRDLIKQMQDNLRKDKVDSQGFIEAAKSYVRLLRSHIQKENAILFPLIEVKMSASEQAELLRNFENYEEEVIGKGRHEKLHILLETLKDKYLI